MLKRFSYFFAYVLLVLMPLQGFAAANMSICNSMMRVQAHSMKQMQNMPCHKHMASITKSQDGCKHKAACKTNCATLCASLSSMTALATPNIQTLPVLVTPLPIVTYGKTYTSYTPPNLQRPPIFFS